MELDTILKYVVPTGGAVLVLQNVVPLICAVWKSRASTQDAKELVTLQDKLSERHDIALAQHDILEQLAAVMSDNADLRTKYSALIEEHAKLHDNFMKYKQQRADEIEKLKTEHAEELDAARQVEYLNGKRVWNIEGEVFRDDGGDK